MKFDVAIIGSGFAGSILAWILASRGRKVALIDAAIHPRFAIGESSTPIADKLLMRLGQHYDLPELVQLSTYGGWQQHHGEIACGKKRGFSYFFHDRGEPFSDAADHDRSLLVAASAGDNVADTHWYRSEMDAYLFSKAIQCCAVDFTGRRVVGVRVAEYESELNRVVLADHDPIEASYLIDASGRASVLAALTGAADLSSTLSTNTRSVFAHYRDVKSWSAKRGEPSDPFDADDAAQHHLVGNAWMWMLRFNNGVTSVGLTGKDIAGRSLLPNDYPGLMDLFREAEFVAPENGPLQTGRLQRLFDPVVGSRCWMLPTSAVTIDPLHSTGIAHALAGVDRSAQMILDGCSRSDVKYYGQRVTNESRFLDQLVSIAYESMNDFSRFTTACMLYFAAAIACEERYQAGETPSQLFSADDDGFANAIDDLQSAFASGTPTAALTQQARQKLAPWNGAGLLDPSVKNRYAYTATKA